MDFREILNSEFKKRNQVNEKYSLRSFSNLLDLDTSTLSQILKGKRKIPKSHWHSIADKLSLSGETRQAYLKTLLGEFISKDLSDNLQSVYIERESEKLDDSSYFEIIAEWEFAAALSLFNIDEFEFSPNNLIKKLGISLLRANEIYSKMFKYELVRIEDEKIIPRQFNFHTSEEVLSLALQKAHKNEISLALQKIVEVPVNKREYQSITLSVQKKDIPKMKLWIKEAIKDFDQKFEKKSNADEVYLLSVQLFPLTEVEQ